MNAKPIALDSYLARAAAICVKMARLNQLADDHFGLEQTVNQSRCHPMQLAPCDGGA